MPASQPEPLIFPRGVRFPTADEFPAGAEFERERVAQASITTGYCETQREGSGASAYFEANVHAPQIWQVVRELAGAILPEVAAPIIGVKGEEPVLGPYTTRGAAIAVFEPYTELLQHDGFLEFGLIFQSGGRTEEVFVRSVKYIQVWTNNPVAVRAVLARHAIPEVPQLEFIDEFPRVSSSLRTAEGNARWPEALEGLRAAFEQLPRV